MSKLHTSVQILSLKYLESLLDCDRIELQQLANTSGRFYKPFDLHKKGTNKWRHIDNPQYPLKGIQKKILKRILNKELCQLPPGMTGGVSGKSIVDNAKVHVGKDCIGIVDIKNCFPNISHNKVHRVWIDCFGCGAKTANILTKLTTFQHRLPQGAPTSPLLCNYVLTPIFNDFKKYSEKTGLDASMFIDDITISGDRKEVEEAIEYIVRVLLKNKYAVKRRKVKVITSGYCQKVTGITVNAKLSINRQQFQEIRNLIIENAKFKDFIPSSKYNKIQGLVSFTKQVSKTQGFKLEEFAELMLIKPVLQTRTKGNDQIRTCKKFSRNHIYESSL